MDVDVAAVAGRTTVRVTGELDVATCADLAAALAVVLRRTGAVRVDLDLAGVTFLDATGYGALVAGLRTTGGTSPFVVAASGPVRRLLVLFGDLDLAS